MYNANKPADVNLPSTKQLLISTVVALVAAFLILIIAILPAEYGIDPTGLGKKLSLTQMGEIKAQLAEEALQDQSLQGNSSQDKSNQNNASQDKANTVTKAEEQPLPAAPLNAAQAVSESVSSKVAANSEQVSVTLKPGQAAEIKLAMKSAETVEFSWSVNVGHVNFDTHADNRKVKYHNYSKGKAVTQDKGQLTAAFDGMHGWFWRNRSKEQVTVTLDVSGDFTDIKRVL